ncbi:hypothetical protein LguiB_010461 [Lonicera macranthoides]
MSPKSEVNTITLILTCLSILIGPTLAQVGSGDTDGGQCLDYLRDIKDCTDEILTSFLTLRIQFSNPTCCKAFIDGEDCWLRLFPLIKHSFAPLVVNYCNSLQGPLSPPPPPPHVEFSGP